MGKTIIIGGSQGGGGGGAVDSVFGRTGTVVAQTNDYKIGQIEGAIKQDNPIIIAGNTLNVADADDGKAYYFTNGGIVNVQVASALYSNPNFKVYFKSENGTVVRITNISGTVDNKAVRVLYGTEYGTFRVNPINPTDFGAINKTVTPNVIFNFHKDGTVTGNSILVPPTGQNNPDPTGNGTANFGGTLNFASLKINKYTTNNSTSYIDFQFQSRIGDGSSVGLYSAGSGNNLGGAIRLNLPNTLGAQRFDLTDGAFLDVELPSNQFIYCYVLGQTATQIIGAGAILRMNDIQ